MKITDMISRLVRSRREPGPEALLSISRHLDTACASDDFNALAALLERYRHSDFVTNLIGVRMLRGGYPMICTPAASVREDVLYMMDRVRDTRIVRQWGFDLTAIAPERYNPLYDLLAMHTFMVDAYSKQHTSGLPRQRPTASAAAASVRLLDAWHKADYVRELSGLILRHECPSEYLSLRLGWEKEYHHAHSLACECDTSCEGGSFAERQMLYDARERHYARWERKAERVLESIAGHALPSQYAVKLQNEREQLAFLVRCPESIAAPHTELRLLYKYGIDATESRWVREQQLERAFRDLDARLMHMTGCGSPSASLAAVTTPRDPPRASTVRICRLARSILRAHRTKGCKHGL